MNTHKHGQVSGFVRPIDGHEETEVGFFSVHIMPAPSSSFFSYVLSLGEGNLTRQRFNGWIHKSCCLGTCLQYINMHGSPVVWESEELLYVLCASLFNICKPLKFTENLTHADHALFPPNKGVFVACVCVCMALFDVQYIDTEARTK